MKPHQRFLSVALSKKDCRSRPRRWLSCFAPADTQQAARPAVSETQRENKEKIEILSENRCLWLLSGIGLSDLNLLR